MGMKFSPQRGLEKLVQHLFLPKFRLYEAIKINSANGLIYIWNIDAGIFISFLEPFAKGVISGVPGVSLEHDGTTG